MRLIDADALKAKLKIGTNNATYSDYCNGYYDARCFDIYAIDCAPTIEPEVRRAYWEPNEVGEYHCTHCGVECDIDQFHKAILNCYCGNCGARMDGGAENAIA